MSEEILRVNNVSRIYETSGGGFGRKNRVSALDGVSFNLVQGELLDELFQGWIPQLLVKLFIRAMTLLRSH